MNLFGARKPGVWAVSMGPVRSARKLFGKCLKIAVCWGLTLTPPRVVKCFLRNVWQTSPLHKKKCQPLDVSIARSAEHTLTRGCARACACVYLCVLCVWCVVYDVLCVGAWLHGWADLGHTFRWCFHQKKMFNVFSFTKKVFCVHVTPMTFWHPWNICLRERWGQVQFLDAWKMLCFHWTQFEGFFLADPHWLSWPMIYWPLILIFGPGVWSMGMEYDALFQPATFSHPRTPIEY